MQCLFVLKNKKAFLVSKFSFLLWGLSVVSRNEICQGNCKDARSYCQTAIRVCFVLVPANTMNLMKIISVCTTYGRETIRRIIVADNARAGSRLKRLILYDLSPHNQKGAVLHGSSTGECNVCYSVEPNLA